MTTQPLEGQTTIEDHTGQLGNNVIADADLPHCRTCKRGMRPPRSNKADYPKGTIVIGNPTECGTCRNARCDATQNKPPTPRPRKVISNTTPCTECLHCNKPLRPRGTTARVHPGTVEHRAGGHCTKCTLLLAQGGITPTRMKPNAPEKPEHLDPRDQSNWNSLTRYMNNRRGKGVPAEGIPISQWATREQNSLIQTGG